MPDVIDEAQEREQRDRDTALAEAATRRRIEESMRPFDISTPRWCVDCHVQIEPQRLAAMPVAMRCTCCATRREQELRAGR